MPATKHEASAKKACFLAFSFCLITGLVAHADFQKPENKMDTFIEIRIANQSISDAMQAIAAAGNVDVKINEQQDDDKISDWKASGKLHKVLDAFSKEHSLCMHFDGLKLDVIPASSASLEVVPIAEDANKAKQQFRFAIPWSSSNAVTFDKTGRLAKICGSAEVIEISKRYFERPYERKINIIRYSIPSN